MAESIRRIGVRFSDHYERQDLPNGRVLLRLVDLGIVVFGDSAKEAEEAFGAAFLDLATSDGARVVAFLEEHSKPLEPIDLPPAHPQVE